LDELRSPHCKTFNAASSGNLEEIWEVGDIGRDPARLVFGKQLGRQIAGPVVASRITAARSFLGRPRLTDSFLLFAESERSSFP
jgi:hypothetical protein